MLDLESRLTSLCGPIQCADSEALFRALMQIVRQCAEEKCAPVQGRKLYYISAEFLIGRLLTSNLMNLGLYDEAKVILEKHGRSLADIEEAEPEPALGNGGLGRLAACFLDSLAALGLPGDGVGILYHCGLFRQRFEHALQREEPDFWLRGDSWAERTEVVYPVSLGGKEVRARLYRIAVTGGERTNRLNLFDLDSADESIIGPGICFPKDQIEKNLPLFLYPDDSDEAGRRLRLYQQYFMVSAGAQLILDECISRGCNLHNLADFAAIQINDTHPSMIIPELIRLLGEKGIDFDEAVSIVSRTCAYTNHTILAEALEKWPMETIEAVAPQLVNVIRRLDGIARQRTENPAAIIDEWNRVHMAHMDIHFTHSVNGVAALHTEILKNAELNHFYRLYPEKFRSVTNGISFRRWLLGCNPDLTAWIEEKTGPDFRRNADALEGLLSLKEDAAALAQLAAIKAANKRALAVWLERTQGVTVDPRTMFSIQAKRLHEYKRQQLNLLFLIHQLLEIRAGHPPAAALTGIFGAKAAPAYTIAKDVIHALRVLAKVIDADEAASGRLKVVFIENYNVSAAEKLVPACDLSEQISLAGKEASGTGNMKFMLNGAVTLGTMDGANVEIAQRVGRENIYIFGQTSGQVLRRSAAGDYCAREWYEADDNLRRAIDFLTGGEMLSFGNRESLERLKNELVNRDWFQTLPDFNAYIVRKQQAMADYAGDLYRWQKKCLTNIAMAGYFSSDRTIREYDQSVWNLSRP